MDIQEIKQMRFDAFAAYCRNPLTLLMGQELRWFEIENGKILATVIRDRIDGDFGGILLARDKAERYRFVADAEAFLKSPEEVIPIIARKAADVLLRLDEERVQGDEQGKAVDFFLPLVQPERMNIAFKRLLELEGYSPARNIIEPMMRWYQDPDGNFIEQFQTTGFDARLWELYLFAAFTEAGFAIDRSEPAPDFVVDDLICQICVEATTVNPSRDAKGNVVPPPAATTEAEFTAVRQEYLPIKYAGPLTAKLAKHYWKQKHVAGKPLIFAIQDFHAPMSMTMSRSALPLYLYGMAHDWEHDANGQLQITPRKVASHTWGQKTIPSGFFALPDSENVSAVLFNNSATISKFNRMGMLASFGSNRVRMTREGFAVNPDPNAAAPKKFRHEVHAPGYSETWVEGMDIYHNPFAKFPLARESLPEATHHFIREDGQVESFGPKWQPLSSTTFISLSDGA